MLKREMLQKLAVVVLFITILNIPEPAALEAKSCFEGLLECLGVAALTIIGNVYVGAGVAAWCWYGYSWCKQWMA